MEWVGLPSGVVLARGVCFQHSAGGGSMNPLVQLLGRGALYILKRGGPAVAFELPSSAGYPDDDSMKLTPMTKEQARRLAADKLRKRRASKQTK